MRRFIGTALAGVAWLVLGGVGAQAAPAADKAVTAAAENAHQLTVAEVFHLFGNRTWLWPDGAGYFQVSKRQFTSWVKKGADASYAEGVWFLPGDGELCFRATWHAVSGSNNATTCFEQRTDGRRIYQRRLPDGDWYVFSHRPVRRDDEVRKLIPGDAVATGYERNKAYVTEKTGANACLSKGRVTVFDLLFGC